MFTLDQNEFDDITVFLGNVFPSGWVRLIAVVFERRNDSLNTFIAHTVNGFAIRS